MLENTWVEMKERTFVNVKSSITDKVYRVLFYKDGICDTIDEFHRKVFERDKGRNSEKNAMVYSF